MNKVGNSSLIMALAYDWPQIREHPKFMRWLQNFRWNL